MKAIKDGIGKPINGTKKTFVYSSEEARNFCEGALGIKAAITGKNISETLEQTIEKAFLPENQIASNICKKLYMSQYNNMDALEQIFGLYYAHYKDWDNGLKFVNYTHMQLKGKHFPEEPENMQIDNNWQSFLIKFQRLVDRMREEDTETFSNESYEFMLKTAHKASLVPSDADIFFFTDFIRTYWKYLKDTDYTYTALESLCRLMAPEREDSAKDREELIELIKSCSIKWGNLA